jgi:hypothetical protein
MPATTIRLVTLALFLAGTGLAADDSAVTCEGFYPQHLQGVCRDDSKNLYWSFTTRLVKTDANGKLLQAVEAPTHQGDLCFLKGKLYVAVNLGKFNDAKGNADSWVYVYDASNLSLLAKHRTPEVFHGAGGIAFHEGKVLVVGGLPEGVKENYLYEYDTEFKFVKKHTLGSGHTLMGIQTAAFADGQWWFGCYGTPKILLRADAALTKVARFEFDGSLGIVPLGQGKFLIGRDTTTKGKGHTGSLVPAMADAQMGLKLVEKAKSNP